MKSNTVKSQRSGAKVSEKPSSSRPTRAEQKLLDFANYLHFDFKGKTVLDIGSSTGGFTKVALAAGAKHVIAVEKGTGQMRAPLRFDPRIDLREKTDFFDLRPADFPENINVVLADVSFVSLKPILKHLKTILPKDSSPDLLIMMKPQFEADPRDLNRGVVKNERLRRAIIKNFELWLRQNDFIIVNKHDNLISGKNGNVERFYRLKIS